MCTSFVYRKDRVLVGMNFDNDGKKYKISDDNGKGFLLSVKIGARFLPSIGVNSTGIFVNDQMVDPNGKGVYKRQNDKRWVTSTLVDNILKTNINFEEITTKIKQIEIVNVPKSSTHNLIVDKSGHICVVEPGSKNIISKKDETDWFALTNFPISEYNEILPKKVSGSGSNRYIQALKLFEEMKGQITVDVGFDILKNLQQIGPDWITELSIIYDATSQELYYCQHRNFEDITKISLGYSSS